MTLKHVLLLRIRVLPWGSSRSRPMSPVASPSATLAGPACALGLRPYRCRSGVVRFFIWRVIERGVLDKPLMHKGEHLSESRDMQGRFTAVLRVSRKRAPLHATADMPRSAVSLPRRRIRLSLVYDLCKANTIKCAQGDLNASRPSSASRAIGRGFVMVGRQVQRDQEVACTFTLNRSSCW